MQPDGTAHWWIRSSKGTWIAFSHQRVIENEDGSITLLSRQRPPPDRPAQVEGVSVLAMEIRAGDRLTDEQGEWEVDTHPAALYGGKSLHARLRKVGEPVVVRYVTWPVHEKVTIRRQA
jgi:hypothetical protein